MLYRDLKGTFTPTMAAFHGWMVIRYPDEFMIAEDEDPVFEKAYRQTTASLNHQADMVMLNGLLRAYNEGVIPANAGFRRRPKH
jgi:hypothetical protein